MSCVLVQVAILFLSVIAKFARKSETSYYFSGASLGAPDLPSSLAGSTAIADLTAGCASTVLLVLNASLYIVITIPSIRNIAK